MTNTSYSEPKITVEEWRLRYFLPIATFVTSNGATDPHDFKGSGWDGFVLDAILATKDIMGEEATDFDCIEFIQTICSYWSKADGLA